MIEGSCPVQLFLNLVPKYYWASYRNEEVNKFLIRVFSHSTVQGESEILCFSTLKGVTSTGKVAPILAEKQGMISRVSSSLNFFLNFSHTRSWQENARYLTLDWPKFRAWNFHLAPQ